MLKNKILEVISEKILEKLEFSKNQKIDFLNDSGSIAALNDLGYYSRDIFKWILNQNDLKVNKALQSELFEIYENFSKEEIKKFSIEIERLKQNVLEGCINKNKFGTQARMLNHFYMQVFEETKNEKNGIIFDEKMQRKLSKIISVLVLTS